MGDVVNLFGNRIGVGEMVIGLILPIRERQGFSRPGGIDRGIDGDVSDVYALRTQILGEALREDALGSLCRGEGRAQRDASE